MGESGNAIPVPEVESEDPVEANKLVGMNGSWDVCRCGNMDQELFEI